MSPASSAVAARPAGPAGDARHEPVVVHFMHLLWRRRWLIAVGSLVPAVIVVLALYLWPRRYTATFVYEHPLTESEYNVLMRRFYSPENLDKICSRLEGNGQAAFAQKLARAETQQTLERLVRFTVSPAYPRRLQTTDPATSEKIGALQAPLLSITIMGDARESMEAIAAVITGDFEDVLPVYAIRKDLKDSIRHYDTLAADIEDQRFTLETELQQEQARLEKLKALEQSDSRPTDDSIVLQFTDIQESHEFLPLAYQVRAVHSKIIGLQETLKSNEEKYTYYLNVVDLNERLLDGVERGILAYYTIDEFLASLGEEVLACQDKAISDYLKSYIRKTNGLVLVNTRAGEKPVVHPVPKYVARSGALTFVVFLMVTTFAAVLLECRNDRYGNPQCPHRPRVS